MDRKTEYANYLASEEWQKKRHETLVRDLGRCRLCNSSVNLQVHHRKYPGLLGSEPLIDLITLCRSCHEVFHIVQTNVPIKKSNPPNKSNEKISQSNPYSTMMKRAKAKLLSEGVRVKGSKKHVVQEIRKLYPSKYPAKKHRTKKEYWGIIESYLKE